jgi:tetratricopeptide (TPR) repeat protein
MGMAHFLRGEYDEAGTICAEVLKLLGARTRDCSLEVSVVRLNLALVLKAQGRFGEAMQQVTLFLGKVEAVTFHKNVDWLARVAYAYQISGELQFELGHFDVSRRFFSRALEHRETVYGIDQVCVAETLTSLGRTLYNTGRFDDALTVLERAARIPLKPEHDATVHCHMGHVHLAKGDLLVLWTLTMVLWTEPEVPCTCTART